MAEIFHSYKDFLGWIKENASVVFAVTGSMLARLDEGRFLNSLKESVSLTVFSDFKPNPDISSVINGTDIARNIQPDLILAVGGGSAIDVAKSIKAEYETDCLLAVIPTTAGSGSEATKIAVIYKDGVKQSLKSPKMAADAILFDPDILPGLPDYQKRSTLSDALCHAIESMWSIRATEESIAIARSAADAIFANYRAYLNGDTDAARCIQKAAYDAGRAIDITATTGGHAMAYKLTKMKGLAHGHACLLAVKQLWDYMLVRGTDLGPAAEYKDAFDEFYGSVDLEQPELSLEDVDLLASSVNQERLKNNPLMLSTAEIATLYRMMAKENL